MRVKKVYLENFLSYENLFVEFGDGLNVLVGHNAAGKTNLLESIYYSSVGKSARGLRDKELIRWGASGNARIRLAVDRAGFNHTVDIALDAQGKKRIALDGLPITKIGELMGAVCVVFFSPTEMKLVKDSPADRRRFMDISICQRDKNYFYTLVRYNKLLVQRNKLLKEYKNSPTLADMNAILTEKMCRAQEVLMAKRKVFVDSLAPVAAEKHAKLTLGKEKLTVGYETEDVDFNNVYEGLKTLYEKNYQKDARLEYTTVGVHRDDIKIAADGVDIRKYGSQGQQRTAVLSMKLAEVEMFKKESGEYPVLLMDDVLSELDEGRRKALFESIDGVQTFITCTEFNEKAEQKNIYSITNGKVTKL